MPPALLAVCLVALCAALPASAENSLWDSFGASVDGHPQKLEEKRQAEDAEAAAQRQAEADAQRQAQEQEWHAQRMKAAEEEAERRRRKASQEAVEKTLKTFTDTMISGRICVNKGCVPGGYPLGSTCTCPQLPPEVEYDRMLIVAQQYFEQEKYAQAAAELEKMRALAKKHKLKEPGTFLFRYAQISTYNGEPRKAVGLLHELLRKEGKNSPHYTAALKLLAEQEAAQQEAVDLAAAHKESLDKYRRDGAEALHAAARKGDLAGIEALLAAGADVNAKDEEGENGVTPLHFAVWSDRTNAAKALLAAGADANQDNTDGHTVLMLAVSRGNLAIVKALVAAGADVNAKEERGYTPLHLAAWYGLPNVAKVLVVAGANTKAKNNNGRTPYKECRKEGFSRKTCKPFK